MALLAAEPTNTERGTAVTARRLLVVAATLLALAAAIHATLVPAHLREWLPAGVFFAVLAAGQASLAVSLLRRAGPVTVLASIWTSVAVIGVYVWSRTAGLPFAPVDHAGAHGAGDSQLGHAVGGHGNGVPNYPNTPKPSSVESVGTLDLAALAAELSVIALLVCLLPARQRQWTGNAILICGVSMLVLRATAVLS